MSKVQVSNEVAKVLPLRHNSWCLEIEARWTDNLFFFSFSILVILTHTLLHIYYITSILLCLLAQSRIMCPFPFSFIYQSSFLILSHFIKNLEVCNKIFKIKPNSVQLIRVCKSLASLLRKVALNIFFGSIFVEKGTKMISSRKID